MRYLRGAGAALAGVLLLVLAAGPAVADISGSQKKAAEEFLAAAVAGDPRAIALAIHEQQLELLRKRIVDELRLEADRNESLIRTRLFGSGMPLAEIERMTAQTLFVTLSNRLRFNPRRYESIDWLDAVKDDGGMVHVIGRLRPAKEDGNVRVPVLVSLVPWGKDWKAAIPFELQAQLDDVRMGRTRAPGVTIAPAPAVSGAPGGAAPSSAPGSGAGAGAPSAPAPAEGEGSPKAILDLFTEAEANLANRRCEEFYSRNMSPNFRRTTAAKALRTLISACESREEIRERYISALQLARATPPRFEYPGTRAVYDLRGKGLPFAQLAVEQVDKRWYIAD